MNKITTQSYLIKRLKDSGYLVWKIFEKYPEADPRKFTILIDPYCAAVYCTCYENYDELDSTFFELHDGGRFLPFRYRVKTDSFEVIAKCLTDFGIVNKFSDD